MSKTAINNRVLFIHIPKCGGRTFNSILDSIYPSQDRFDIRVVKNIKSNMDEFHSMSQEDKDGLKLVKGHQHFGLHSEFSTPSEYISFLRNPIERVVSYYYFVMRIPNHRLFQTNKINKNTTLIEFVSEVDEADLHNGQIRFLSGIKASEREMLDIARKNIEKHFSFVGTLENFNECLVLLRRQYNWPTPYYRIKNKTKGRPILSDINKEVIEIIRSKNQGDIDLYNETKKLIEYKISKDPSISFEASKIKNISRIKFLVSDTLVKVKNATK